MTTLRRYVSVRFALAFGAVFLILTLVVIVIDLLLHVEEILGGGRGVLPALALLVLRSVALYLPILLPITTFIAAFLAVGFAARARETIAIKAAGISPLRAMLPVLLAAALASVATLVLTETVSVPVAAALERQSGEDRVDLYRSADGIWYHKGRFVYNVRSAGEDGDALEDVRIFERDAGGRVVRVIEARRAERQAGSRWRFEDARVRSFDPARPDRAPQFSAAPEMELVLEEDDGGPRLGGDLESVPLWQLVGAPAGAATPRMRSVLHGRLSDSLLALALALVAVPLGLGVERSRSLVRPAAQGALLLLAVLGVREYAGSSLGASGPGVVASWSSLALVAAWGAFRLARAPL